MAALFFCYSVKLTYVSSVLVSKQLKSDSLNDVVTLIGDRFTVTEHWVNSLALPVPGNTVRMKSEVFVLHTAKYKLPVPFQAQLVYSLKFETLAQCTTSTGGKMAWATSALSDVFFINIPTTLQS